VHLPPEAAALAGETCAFAGDADVLAGKTPSNDIDSPSPCGPVELGNVIVNLHVCGQVAIGLPRPQNATAVRVDLHRADGLMPEKHASEDAASRASEQM
jgi:hypothetical protein